MSETPEEAKEFLDKNNIPRITMVSVLMENEKLNSQINTYQERIKELERSLDYEKNRIRRLLTTDGKGSDYKAELLANLLNEIRSTASQTVESEGVSAEEALQWLSNTLNKMVRYSDSHQHIIPTYQIRSVFNELISEEKTPLEAIRSAMANEKKDLRRKSL